MQIKRLFKTILILLNFKTANPIFSHIHKNKTKTKTKTKLKNGVKTMSANFETEAKSYYNAVSEDLFTLLLYNECTIEEVFNYLKNNDKSTAKDLLLHMRECRLSRDCDFSELESSSTREDLDAMFMEYGLELNYNESKDLDDYTQDSFRFLITYGGPHAEVKFYSYNCIEFIYRSGNNEKVFTVTLEPEFIALREHFDSCGELNFEDERAVEGVL